MSKHLNQRSKFHVSPFSPKQQLSTEISTKLYAFPFLEIFCYITSNVIAFFYICMICERCEQAVGLNKISRRKFNWKIMKKIHQYFRVVAFQRHYTRHRIMRISIINGLSEFFRFNYGSSRSR